MATQDVGGPVRAMMINMRANEGDDLKVGDAVTLAGPNVVAHGRGGQKVFGQVQEIHPDRVVVCVMGVCRFRLYGAAIAVSEHWGIMCSSFEGDVQYSRPGRTVSCGQALNYSEQEKWVDVLIGP